MPRQAIRARPQFPDYLRDAGLCRCNRGGAEMPTTRVHHLFEMLHYWSDTFARLPLTNLKDVGHTAVTLISSILNYEVSALLVAVDRKEPTLLASKGIDRNVLSMWNPEQSLLRHLWTEYDAAK